MPGGEIKYTTTSVFHFLGSQVVKPRTKRLIVNCLFRQLADKNGGKGKPEMRMPALIFGSFFVPIGLLYAWPYFFGVQGINFVFVNKLVRLVCPSEASLDYADDWHWDFRFW